ncbi:centrosomal protein of 170 kDa protein B isoform X2 [Fundulus heteroclitus]|uniref:centrosomal protein of 170 kDa protein B isoform X2 n=1 Tax=Fundulus heteroclitus TaxID=8078 RepID=UPI00165C6B35|nr:centrosomal protein of 170 kDa protein B isoform X2 [Fundulus heteroclitus]
MPNWSLNERVAAGASGGDARRDAITAAASGPQSDPSEAPTPLQSAAQREAAHAPSAPRRVTPGSCSRAAAGSGGGAAASGAEDALRFASRPVKMSVTSWFLVSSSGTRHRLPREMIFVGREDCELMLQSRSVDKQHAVINYNPTTDEHLVKDLGSLNGTFVNDLRIPDQTYITLKLSDIIRFGYDSHVYVLEKSQHKVPEEALKHEKYSSQLQMSLKAAEGRKSEEEERQRGDKTTSTKAVTQETPVSRPTPLYGQPSWWGEEDYGSKVQSSDEPHPDFPGSLSDSQPKTVFPSYHREPSYFEIPTKDFQHQKASEAELHEIPTKDTDAPNAPPSPPTPTPPVVQSHASFTIEFDDCMPGKIKIKDHVTKFSTRQRKAQAAPVKTAPSAAAPTDMMSAQSKVADWLVHSDVSMMRRHPPCEDVYSTKSDLAMNIKTLKGHHHEDGTQSDSEDPVLKSQHSVQSEQTESSGQAVQSSQQPVPTQKHQHVLQYSPPRQAPSSAVAPERPLSQSPPHPPSPTETPKQGPSEHLTQQAFIIEFFDDNPRKKRSQSFTHNPAHGDSYSTLKAKIERRKGGERPASMHGHIPPTQQVTVPLKGQGHSGPQRSSSLKREKTEGEPASSSSSSRSSSGIVIRPFGSVGKKSKLAQEFAAEFLKDSVQKDTSPTRDKDLAPPMSAPPVMVSPPHAQIPSPQEPPALSSVSYPSSPLQPSLTKSFKPPSGSVQAAPLVHPSGPHMSPMMSLAVRGGDPKVSQRMVRNEEDDSLSDAGTYTIETESQDQEVEEARNMIDQVFGVLDSPEYSGATTGVYRPVIHEGKDEPRNLPGDGSSADLLHGFIPAAVSAPPTGPMQVQPHGADLEGPRWVSRWASLADSYAEPGSTPPQVDCLEDLRYMSHSMGSYSYDTSESETSHSSRTRRLLPQVPPDKVESGPPSILIRHESYQGHKPLDRVHGPPCSQDSAQRLVVQDDVDPDSLSDASRSEDGAALVNAKKFDVRTGNMSPGYPIKVQEKVSPTNKSTFFYIGAEEHPGKPEPARSPVQGEKTRDPHAKTPPTTVLIRHLSGHEPRRTGVKPNNSAPNLQTQDKDAVPTKDGNIVRQESFTKDRPSDTIQMKKLPHISSHPSIRDMEQSRESIQETEPFLQDTEGTLSSLDTKLPSCGSGHSSKKGGSSTHMDDSLSGESDVDTASTVSQVSSKNAPVGPASKKRPAVSSLQKEKSSSSPSIQEKGRQLSARERLSEKRRTQTAADAPSKAEAAKRLQMRRSTGNRGSLDLSEGQQGAGPNWTESTSSDHEVSRPSGRTKKVIAPLQKEDNGKTPKSATQQVLTRSNSLSAPRPTRASMLRRARLGEASDNEGTETDRASQNSDHVSAPTKASGEAKKLSRLDILAMPRKRTGSFTTPSDNESSTSRSGFSGRNNEPAATARKTSVGDARQAASRGGGAPVKQTLTRTRSSGVKHLSSGSRRKQKGSDFSSSSEEEYEKNTDFKAKRSSHSTSAGQSSRGQRTAASRSKSVSLETEEEEDQNDMDPYQNWSTHSAEIAKLSQDLAKDLAILAKEIHDVAGDGDSPSSGMGTTTSPTSLPNTPASTMSAREETPSVPYLHGVRQSQLVHRIPEASLNYQKVPPGSAAILDLDANMNEPEPSSLQRRPWNREEVILDNLMLNPVSQLSQAIRENTEQLAEKMKVLFQNKADVWEEIEAKINTENEVPILKTSNKEITSILKELRRVQRQLEVINTIVEPGGSLQAAAMGTSSQPQTRQTSKDKKPTTKPRTSNANESTKRPPRGPDGSHHMP